MPRVCLAVCLLVLAAAPSAQAGVIRAESVLPPGQSGFVSRDGVANGTGSPHLYDQLDLLTSFRFKPATFGQPAASVEEPRPGVKIARDAYGVPAITAATERDLWWAVGYATAQDRLAQIELFRHAAAGRLAELLGDGSLEDDLVARRDYYTDGELRRQLARLPLGLRARFPAYADGVNAWMERVRADASLLPAEFAALNVELRPWTVLDSARIGVLLLRTTPSDDGNELGNLEALRAVGAEDFDRLLPLRVPGQVTTIPTQDGRWPSQPGRTRAQEAAAYRRSLRAVRRMPLPRRARGAVVETGGVRDEARRILGGQGSFMWAIRRESDRHTFLVSGPQLGYNAPQRLHELELHAPGLDVRGVVPPGVPALAIGHNGRVAWGFTSALSDDDDLYAERLRAPGSTQYRFRGRWRRMSCRTETFRVRGGKARRERLCRTVHGPVQARAGRVAYARRYAIWNREAESIEGIDALNRARDLGDVDRAMRLMTWTENVMAADDQGNIGFWHPGNYPLRPLGYDERLPFPGTGKAEWRGLLPRDAMARVVNPAGRNWLVNWNNAPSADFTSGDNQAREQLNGPLHRVRLLTHLIGGAVSAPQLTFDSATAGIVRESGTTATQRTALEPTLRRVAPRATLPGKDVIETLLAWDGDYATTGEDGRVAPGVATWRAFKAAAQQLVMPRVPRGARGLVGTPGGEGFVEATLGETYALRVLNDRGVLDAADMAAEALHERFRETDPAAWREPRTMIEASPLGLAQAPDIGLINRGSWEQLVELGP